MRKCEPPGAQLISKMGAGQSGGRRLHRMIFVNVTRNVKSESNKASAADAYRPESWALSESRAP